MMAAGEGAVAAARALRNALAHLPREVAAEVLMDEFPWLGLLPEESLAQFVTDFVTATRISADLGEWSVLAQTVREWRATAAVYTDPRLVRELSEPLSEDHGPVPGPTEA
ncbi:hypothetical protein GA0070617_1307 [Micromonospora yangpuensis]|uniref:Uncharacterized protein n=2 Tax=Micromonosporaceae TaxID=28056 RepID=A0A1C6U724_9ACTN|nr:hypothetical protein GA0070617_1307 [Micromonospora yangpuensis]